MLAIFCFHYMPTVRMTRLLLHLRETMLGASMMTGFRSFDAAHAKQARLHDDNVIARSPTMSPRD